MFDKIFPIDVDSSCEVVQNVKYLIYLCDFISLYNFILPIVV